MSLSSVVFLVLFWEYWGVSGNPAFLLSLISVNRWGDDVCQGVTRLPHERAKDTIPVLPIFLSESAEHAGYSYSMRASVCELNHV